MSKIIILIFSFIIVSADTFNFTELRYSDALGKSMELQGEISFFEDGLDINYKDSKKSLHLKGAELIYREDKKEVALEDSQKQNITQYLEMIVLFHSADEILLQSMFDIEKKDDMSLLKPIGTIRHYINNIELLKQDDKVKMIKLFLKNSDQITIKIDDEIR